MRRIVLALLQVVVLTGCTGGLMPSATPSPIAPPTATPLPTVVPTSGPPATPGLSLMDKEPGAVTLSYGSDSQMGSGGGGTWCVGGICSVGDIFDLYSAPAIALRAPQGGVLTFAYLGYNAVLSAQVTLYPFPPPNPRINRFYSPPDSRLGKKADVNRSGQRATSAADVPPGEYMVIVFAAITDMSNSISNLYFHFRVLVQ